MNRQTLAIFTILLLSTSLRVSGQSDSVWNYLIEIEGSDEWRDWVKLKGVRFLRQMPDSLPKLADKAFNYGDQNDDPILTAAGHNMMAIWLRQGGELDSVEMHLSKALQILRGSDELEVLERTYNYASNNYYEKGNIHLQSVYIDSAYSIADSIGDVEMKRTLDFNRAFLMSELGKPELTGSILLGLLKDLQSDEQPDHSFIAQTALNLGQHYRENKVDSAIYYTNMALEEASEWNILWIEASAEGQLAGYYLHKGEDQKAKELLDKAAITYQTLEDPYGLLMVLLNYSKYYYKSDQLKEAALYADSAVVLSKSIGYQIWARDASKLASEIAEKQGNYKYALQMHQEFKALSDSIEGSEIKSQVAALELKYRAAEQAAEVAELRSKQRVETREKWIVVISSSAVLLILIIIGVGMRNRGRARQKISEKERQRLRAEVSRAEMEEQNLRREVSLKNQQLTAKALHLSQRNQLLESLLEQAEQARESDTPAEKLLPQLVREIKLSLQSDSEWNEFRKYFEELNHDFFEKVKNQIPDVTEKELRLLALTKIGLTIKEIAHLMHVAPNSVKTARYRLKKKLELEEDATLEEFVESV